MNPTKEPKTGMNKRIKTRWLKALRGGKYKQGTEQLKTDEGGYCCLGVLCDLYANTKEGKEAGAHWEGNLFFSEIGSPGERIGLPPAVKRWADLSPNDVTLPLGKVKVSDRIKAFMVNGKLSLDGLNDGTDIGFRGIANRIEKGL